jgi:hypothetical protein
MTWASGRTSLKGKLAWTNLDTGLNRCLRFAAGVSTNRLINLVSSIWLAFRLSAARFLQDADSGIGAATPSATRALS